MLIYTKKTSKYTVYVHFKTDKIWSKNSKNLGIFYFPQNLFFYVPQLFIFP